LSYPHSSAEEQFTIRICKTNAEYMQQSVNSGMPLQSVVLILLHLYGFRLLVLL